MPHDTRSQVIRKSTSRSSEAAELLETPPRTASTRGSARRGQAKPKRKQAAPAPATGISSMEESLRKIPTKIEPANLIDPDEGSGSDVN
jgi:hypothetical protein